MFDGRLKSENGVRFPSGINQLQIKLLQVIYNCGSNKNSDMRFVWHIQHNQTKILILARHFGGKWNCTIYVQKNEREHNCFQYLWPSSLRFDVLPNPYYPYGAVTSTSAAYAHFSPYTCSKSPFYQGQWGYITPAIAIYTLYMLDGTAIRNFSLHKISNTWPGSS